MGSDEDGAPAGRTKRRARRLPVEQLHRDLHAVEGDASDASAAAERALELVSQEAADKEREFVAHEERRRTGGGE